jgi:hypothetical protein
VLKRSTRSPDDTPWLSSTRSCCEWCGRPDGETVPLYDDGVWERAVDYSTEEFDHDDRRGISILQIEDGEIVSTDRPRAGDDPGGYTMSDTVLTIAHLCQDPRYDDLDHLRALCQRCHLTYDQQPEQRARRDRIQAELRGQISIVDHGCSERDGGGCAGARTEGAPDRDSC